MKTKTSIASFNRFELELPQQCVNDCSHSGPCDEDCAFWARKLPIPASISFAAIKVELKEYGAWDADELDDQDANWRRLIWIAACNIADEAATK
jgi:hypothetical protein